nr:sensor histidine kinase [Bacillus sp. 165]
MPFFFYETIRLNRHHATVPKSNRYFVTVLSNIILLFCMVYPIHLGEGGEYDFYQIPIMISFLYGGYGIGIVTALASLVYYAFLNGFEDIWFRAFHVIILSVIPLVVSKKWFSYPKNKKIMIASALAFCYALVYIIAKGLVIVMGEGFTLSTSQMYFNFTVASIIMAMTMIFQIYITEYLYENAFLRVEMHKSEKLNIISELAASVAHEVRNPLTVVRGFIQLLEGSEEAGNKEYMRLVLTELDRAEGIISDYLNLARPQIEVKQHIHLSAQLFEVTTLMSSFAAMQGVYLQTEMEDFLYTVGDKAKLKQAIMNIVKNGVEAIQQNKGYLKVTAKQIADEIIIKVKDSGVGMTKEQIDRLGQPYYSLKEKGTGLGLMVTFSIIQAHNGKLTYKSEVGKGTEAIITLPAAEQP